jgi:hypothetical protein
MPQYAIWTSSPQFELWLTTVKTKLEKKRNLVAQIQSKETKSPVQQWVIAIEKKRTERQKKLADLVQLHLDHYTSILGGPSPMARETAKGTQTEGKGELD